MHSNTISKATYYRLWCLCFQLLGLLDDPLGEKEKAKEEEKQENGKEKLVEQDGSRGESNGVEEKKETKVIHWELFRDSIQVSFYL